MLAGGGCSTVVASGTSRGVNIRAQPAVGVAKHRLPMQINRQPQISRPLTSPPPVIRQHAGLSMNCGPAQLSRNLNLTAISRTLPVLGNQQPAASIRTANSTASSHQHHQQQQTPTRCHAQPTHTPAPSSAFNRMLASPVKDSNMDVGVLEGAVEKKPKYHKHLPLDYQNTRHDHTYSAPPPPTLPTKTAVNGVAPTNGLSRPPPALPVTQPQHTAAPHNSLFNTNRVLFGSGGGSGPGTTSLGAVNNSHPVDNSSDLSSDGGRETEPEGEETETAPEGEGEEEESITRCICDFLHDDGYMISCDKCLVWQHVDCMGIDRSNIPEEYLCELCQPRRVDKQKAIALQLRKRQEVLDTSDTSEASTDSSSVSSVDRTPVGFSTVTAGSKIRKRVAPASGRRRGESARKTLNNNIGTPKESKRKGSNSSAVAHSTPLASPSVPVPPTPMHKKKQEKRTPARRKSGGSQSLMAEKKSSPNDVVQELRDWIDSYEEAVTNHYSPELRARVATIKVNGIHSDLKLPANLLATVKCRVSLLPSGVKILMSCSPLSSNQAIIELRGKYMLSNRGLAAGRGPRPSATPPPQPPAVSTAPTPHIFYYKLPKDNTEVCVDATTYGNDARFVRRSCKPNSEVRHCIEKGALHLYLVTTGPLAKNTEITVGHDSRGEAMLACVCGDAESCTATAQLSPRPSTPPLQPSPSDRNGVVNKKLQTTEKRRRGRRRTVSENSEVTQLKLEVEKEKKLIEKEKEDKEREKEKEKEQKEQKEKERREREKEREREREKEKERRERERELEKEKEKERERERKEKELEEEKEKERQREKERKAREKEMEKEAEKLKAAAAKEAEKEAEEDAATEQKATRPNVSKTVSSPPPPPPATRSAAVASRRATTPASKRDDPVRNKRDTADKKSKMTREERKMEAILKAIERLEKDELRKQEVQARLAQRKDSSEGNMEKEQPEELQPQPAGALTSVSTKNHVKKRRSTPSKRKNRGRSNSSQLVVGGRVTRRTASALQEQQAAVAIAAMKELATPEHSDSEHEQDNVNTPRSRQAADLLLSLSECSRTGCDDKNVEASPERDSSLNTSGSSGGTPPTPLSNSCLLVAAAVGPLAPGFKFPKTKKVMLNSWFRTGDGSPSLAPPLCSPPGSTPGMDDQSGSQPGSGFAKKRWLRQAISEECDSPNSRAEMTGSPTEYVAPLKKRRFARESISSELSVTPPTTPTHSSEQPNQVEDDEENTVSSPPRKSEEHDESEDINCSKDIESDDGNSCHESESEGHDLIGGPRTPPEPDCQEHKAIMDMKEMVEKKIEPIVETTIKAIEAISAVVMPKEVIRMDDDEEEERRIEVQDQPMTREKRKLSISEYRQRKQGGGGGKVGDDERSGSGMAGTPSSPPASSVSSSDDDDDDSTLNSILLEADALTKKAKGVVTRFNSAPTLVERQRENLTERLKREFGLFLSDDEEQEKARKAALNSGLDGPPIPPTLMPLKISPMPLMRRKSMRAPPPPPPGGPAPPFPHTPQLFFPNFTSLPHPPPPPTLEPINVTGGPSFFLPNGPVPYYQHQHLPH